MKLKRNGNRSTLFIQIIGLLASLVLPGSAHAAPEEPAKIPTVFVLEAKAIPLFDVLSYPARIVSKINASLVAETDGVVTRINAPLGRAVKRNERVMLIRNTDPLYSYRPLSVRSAVNGVVTSLEVTPGSRVQKGQKLGTITDPKQITVYIEVASADLPLMAPGLEGELTVTGNEQKYFLQVMGVSPQVDAATGTATCELAPALTHKGQGLLPPGSLGKVSFKVRERVGFQLPESAVVYRNNETFVRVVEEEKAKYQKVVLGPTRRGEVEILSGLKEGTPIVLRASVFIAEGDQVKVQTAETAKFE